MTGSKLFGNKYRAIETEDEYDTRIPLHSEEAFIKGVRYKAKLIGTMDIPKPTNRLEIVSSMRRIRYEFKARSIKKKNISLLIDTEGLKVFRKKRRRRRNRRQPLNSEKYLVMSHPIYRIFYVSHDSQDLKIFSFIARESQSSTFTCSVFKAKKKRHAVRMVRTIGQAFDVCQKLVEDSSDGHGESVSQVCSNGDDSDLSDRHNTDLLLLPVYDSLEKLDLGLRRASPTGNSTGDSACHLPGLDLLGGLELDSVSGDSKSPSELHRAISSELSFQQKSTLHVLDQARALRDALALERSARIVAQQRSQQLLLDNRRLVRQIGQLVHQLSTAATAASADGRAAATIDSSSSSMSQQQQQLPPPPSLLSADFAPILSPLVPVAGEEGAITAEEGGVGVAVAAATVSSLSAVELSATGTEIA